MEEKNPIAELIKTIFEVVKDPASLPGVIFIVGAIFSFTAFIIHKSYEVWKRSIVFCIGLILMGAGVYLWKAKEITKQTEFEELRKQEEEERKRLEEERKKQEEEQRKLEEEKKRKEEERRRLEEERKRKKNEQSTKGSIPTPPNFNNDYTLAKKIESGDGYTEISDTLYKVYGVKESINIEYGIPYLYIYFETPPRNAVFRIQFPKGYSKHFNDNKVDGWSRRLDNITFTSHLPLNPFKMKLKKQ